MAHAASARVGAALGLALLCAGCAAWPHVAVAPDTVAALPHEPRVIAVHYHDLLAPRGLVEPGRATFTYVYAGAPTRRVKDRFVHGMQTTLALPDLRNVAEPRFMYPGRRFMPDPHWLQRTFERGLIFEFYSPTEMSVPARGRVAKIHARLLRIDDLAVLWADSCSFETGPLQNLPVTAPIDEAEPLYMPAALAKADACADRLLAGFLGTNRR